MHLLEIAKMEKGKKSVVPFFVILLVCSFAAAQKRQRPFIWVQQSDRDQILQKIERQPWAKAFYDDDIARLEKDLRPYEASREDFLKVIPLDWGNRTRENFPTFARITDFGNSVARDAILKYVQIGIDCGVLYYLTEDERYAQIGTDILYTFIMGLSDLQPSEDRSNGGWLYSDHLREAREVGAQLPIIYDFIAPFIREGGKPYDVPDKKVVPFPREKAQQVFRTYADLAITHGHTGSNWSVLESLSLVQNSLALEDKEERDSLLNYYLVKGTAQQDALPDIASEYKTQGSVYPETSQYSNGVATRTSNLMVILNNYDSTLNLAKKYSNIPFSLDRWNSLRYPNGEIIRFGDGKRKFGTPYASYEVAYLLGRIDSVPLLREKFGPLINTAIKNGEYARGVLGERTYGASEYLKPTELLWLEDSITGNPVESPLPRTDVLPHAGVFLQRNLSPTGKPEDGLMCFVGGAHYVHGHAGGMDMELYGQGEVLGVDNGRGRYRTDLHENYSRLFAAHNTVIVNGASQGEGGWVNLGMNTVQLVAMEPKPLEDALSPNYSFSTTSFHDDGGDKAEAHQERTLAIVRTSPSTGYYVDVFRSKSDLPNEYHDYVYHNIGDTLQVLNRDLKLKPDLERYRANASKEWVQNRTYRNPGWHFFEDVQSSAEYTEDVRLQVRIEKLKDKSIFMNLFIPGTEGRTYTQVKAPHTFGAPEPYDTLPTPTLIVRKEGGAWDDPFVVVYEPFRENAENGSVQSVEKLGADGSYSGLKIVSRPDGDKITQYILMPSGDDGYVNEDRMISFKGRFAVITYDAEGKLRDSYIGDGDQLQLGNKMIRMNPNTKAAFIDFTGETIEINGNATIELR